MLQFKPASDVALLNAIMHVIVEEGLYDVQYLQAYTEDFESLKQHVTSYSPESVADLCGIAAYVGFRECAFITLCNRNRLIST